MKHNVVVALFALTFVLLGNTVSIAEVSSNEEGYFELWSSAGDVDVYVDDVKIVFEQGVILKRSVGMHEVTFKTKYVELSDTFDLNRNETMRLEANFSSKHIGMSKGIRIELLPEEEQKEEKKRIIEAKEAYEIKRMEEEARMVAEKEENVRIRDAFWKEYLSKCNGEIIRYSEYVVDPYINKKGKCTPIVAKLLQVISEKAGLFAIVTYDRLGRMVRSGHVYIQFKQPLSEWQMSSKYSFLKDRVRGIGKINGSFTYTDRKGLQRTVPYLILIGELSDDEVEILEEGVE